MNIAQQGEINQWLIACKSVVGEDNVMALIEYGYLMAVESFNKPLATTPPDWSDLALEDPLELKLEAYKKPSLFELEAENRKPLKLVVNNTTRSN